MSEKGKHSVFGIRHHGPGSARSLVSALKQLRPDCVLIEGPPEANELLRHVLDDGMKPPVALLIYSEDDPASSVYYPFAIFSPEWQAIRYALQQGVLVRFIDLPQSNWLAVQKEKQLGFAQVDFKQSSNPEAIDAAEEDASEELPKLGADPLSFIAAAAGFDDSERFWESLIEHRRSDFDVFGAISEAMEVLRAELSKGEQADDDYLLLREAHMRQSIRAALKEGFENLAVVCGAWHAPALKDLKRSAQDREILRNLPRTKVRASWIPWTNSRLSFASGYGAGVESPGWYDHLFSYDDLPVARWFSKAARILREEDLDASPAQLVDAVRLAETLAAMRGYSLPGLCEINDAAQSVLCFAGDLPMQLIHDKLIVGQNMGEVPADLPGTPLQMDLLKLQKSLRLPASCQEKDYDLDLRKDIDLARSHLLHRLLILGINWGEKLEFSGKSGTFHELWRLRWQPEFALKIIEAGVWGKSVEECAGAFVCDASDKARDLSRLVEILDSVLLSELSGSVEHVLRRLENESAIAVDTRQLLAALPGLVQIARYGNVRKTNLDSVKKILEGLVSRICVGLPMASSSIDDGAAKELFELINKADRSIELLQFEAQLADWHESLSKLADAGSVHGMLAACATRLLFDKRVFDAKETARRFGLALSSANEPASAAVWVEGFLSGSGIVLIHDDELFSVLDEWLITLSNDNFVQIMPLLRRTFSLFSPAERRQIGEKVLRLGPRPGTSKVVPETADEIDENRGAKVLPVLGRLLGISFDCGDAE